MCPLDLVGLKGIFVLSKKNGRNLLTIPTFMVFYLLFIYYLPICVSLKKKKIHIYILAKARNAFINKNGS